MRIHKDLGPIVLFYVCMLQLSFAPYNFFDFFFPIELLTYACSRRIIRSFQQLSKSIFWNNFMSHKYMEMKVRSRFEYQWLEMDLYFVFVSFPKNHEFEKNFF